MDIGRACSLTSCAQRKLGQCHDVNILHPNSSYPENVVGLHVDKTAITASDFMSVYRTVRTQQRYVLRPVYSDATQLNSTSS